MLCPKCKKGEMLQFIKGKYNASSSKDFDGHIETVYECSNCKHFIKSRTQWIEEELGITFIPME